MIWMIMRCADQSHIVMYFLSGTPNMHLYACNTAYFIMRIHTSSGFYTTWNWKSNFGIYVIMLLQLLSMSWCAMIAVIIWISRPFMIKLKYKGTRNDQFSNACVCLVWYMCGGCTMAIYCFRDSVIVLKDLQIVWCLCWQLQVWEKNFHVEGWRSHWQVFGRLWPQKKKR